ncbi:MAG TPA: AarF/UbiB family protein, partial [Polyangiaceae bacterium]|nr:AarF/UbiB family protein [Polyangiaceae bacterium]
YLAFYGLRRLGTLLESDRHARRAQVARLQGALLRSAMSWLGACFVKLGQVMSSRPDLFEPEMIAELRLLQDKLPPFAFPKVRATLESQLGRPLDQVFAVLDREPVAAASVAQVHHARLRSGDEVAVKVLRPNVRTQVARDGTLLMLAAKLLALHPTIRLSDPVGFTREFVEGLVRQTDLRIEAANYQRFRENFSHDARIAFPLIYAELSSEKVLVMEFVRGVKVDELPNGHDHRQISQTLRAATMQMSFVDGFLHADMHPGNMVVRDDGRLVLLDVGLATELTPEVLEMFVDLMKCVAMGTPEDLVNHLQRYHVYGENVSWDAVRRDVDAFARKFRALDVSRLDYGEMVGEMLAIGRRYHVRPVPQLSLVIVGIVTAQGIGKMLSPEVNDFQEMSKFLIPLLMKRGQKLPDASAVQAGVRSDGGANVA